MNKREIMKNFRVLFPLILLALASFITSCDKEKDVFNNISDLPDISDYPVVSTNQTKFYDNSAEISNPMSGAAFFGQDAHYSENEAQFQDNGDGTTTDMVTGLMWQQNPGSKLTYTEGVASVSSSSLAGHSDWRLPTIKELYSLIDFSGIDPSGYSGTSTDGLVPFINTTYFNFEYGDVNSGSRIIDAQYLSSTRDVGDSEFGGGNLVFGVNFADGRIKGYPASDNMKFFVILVRGNTSYGQNNFKDNGDSTISDIATGLMWMQGDSKVGMNWEDALAYSEAKTFASFGNWRLPNAKELQSILDYSRAPGATASAAINTMFRCTSIQNENGENDYPYYWSSTTHSNWSSKMPGGNAAYLSFGRAMGYFNGEWMDVHGAGAQRGDPKAGDPAAYPTGHGPQGDAIRILNYVRLVRDLE
jgi:hypothetical protein